MNQHDVRLLQQIRNYPAVTITLPTHRIAPQNRQDPIRVRNLVNEATNRLLGEFSRREISPLLTRLEELTNSIDYRFALDGLALFVGQDIARAVYLPFAVKERVVVDETFFTRDLVLNLHRSPRYWVLALSEQPTRLYEGLRDTLIEVQEEGFPLVHTGPGGSGALPGGAGVSRSAYRDERHRQFFRQVDETLKVFMRDDPLPLALVGVDRYLAFFDQVTSHKSAIVTTVTGSHDKTPAHELAKIVWPMVKANYAAERQQTLQELDRAVSERRVVSTVGEVWRLANEGRARLLAVEEDYHVPARLDPSGTHLIPVDDATEPGVIDDAVDEIIETVMNKGGQVRFMDNGQLDRYSRIAVILRY